MAVTAASSSSYAGPILLVVSVAALSLIASADARPCGHAQTLLVSYFSVSRPNPDPSNPTPVTATVVTVRRLGPHQHLQIRRPEALLPANDNDGGATTASSAQAQAQQRAKDILVVVSGLLFGFGCGALTAASMYLVWSLLCDDDEDQLPTHSDDSPKKAGYVIIHDADEEYATTTAGKN